MESPDSSWSEMPMRERREQVSRAGKIIASRHREIETVIARETGKPITEAASQEVTAALEMLRYLVKMAPRWLKPERFRYWRPGFWLKANEIRFEPLGAVLVIGPSNFPFSLPVMQSCAALLCGNSVILKPSERCPQTSALIRDLFAKARMPAGALEVVQGGPEVAEEWIARGQIRKVIFTGSCETGRKVAAACGRAFKPCILELGGGSAAIVCSNADLSLAARGIAWSAFYANGRSCVGTRRIFVHRDVSRTFSQLLLREMARIKVGDPLDPNSEIGIPSGDAGEWIRDAIHKGAQVQSKSGTLAIDSPHFEAPLLVTGVSPEMRLMREEVPYPLAAVREVDSEEQALREVNEHPSGLGASIWSRDIRRARILARSIEAGMIWINDSSAGLPQFPWGGRKQSGWGRTFSRHGLLDLTHIKVISSERRRLAKSKIWWFPYSRRKLEIFGSINEWYAGARRMQVLKHLYRAVRIGKKQAPHVRG